MQLSRKSDHGAAQRLFADATADAPTQRASVDCKVRANGRGINEADRVGLATRHGGEPRKRALVVLVLVKIEPQPAAEADRRRKFWL
jgi:hypothetical protein